MTEAVIVALISLAGTIITVLATSKKTEQSIKINQAITDTQLEELTREVRTHNNFVVRLPVVEEQIKVINHRIDDLEAKS